MLHRSLGCAKKKKAKFAIDVSPGDLTFDLPHNAPVSVAYTLLDVLFVCVLSCDFNLFPCQFVDGGLSIFCKKVFCSCHSATDGALTCISLVPSTGWVFALL